MKFKNILIHILRRFVVLTTRLKTFISSFLINLSSCVNNFTPESSLRKWSFLTSIFKSRGGNLFSLYPVTLCRHKHLIGKARVRGSVTIFIRTNGFFLFLLSSLLSDVYVLYDWENFRVQKVFFFCFSITLFYQQENLYKKDSKTICGCIDHSSSFC